MDFKASDRETENKGLEEVRALSDEVASINVSEIDKKTYNKFLLGDGKLFKIIFAGGFLMGLITLLDGGLILFTIPSLVFGYLGFKNLFIKKQAKDDIVKSKLIEQICEEKIQSGKILREEANMIRIKYDVCFRKNAVDIYKQHISSLKDSRNREIKRIEKSRWNVVVKNKFSYNITEGKASINNNICLFSEIKGASIVKTESHRVETKEKSDSKNTGSVVMGGAGSLVGGVSFGKTETTTKGSADVIPTCTHLGVVVEVNNFQHEIVLFNEMIDQTSKKYLALLQEADAVLHSLRHISSIAVPESYLLPEQEKSVLAIDKKILEAEHELELIKEELSI